MADIDPLKRCGRCKQTQPKTEFGRNKSRKDGLNPICRGCRRKYAITYDDTHRKEKNARLRRYENTLPGHLVRMYQNMRNRVRGVNKKAKYLYFGLPLLSRQEFYVVARRDPNLPAMFERYKKSGWSRPLAPSVNRIDSSKGYIEENIEFITLRENTILAGRASGRARRAKWQTT